MIPFLKEHRFSFTVLSVLLLIQSFTVDLTNPFRKPIAGDAQGYYAYLPAVFIYQDLTFEFMQKIQSEYYVPSTAKKFLNDVNGRKVNKYFPGQALMYAPFFFTAHGGALLLDLPADGFSYIYQFFFLVGFWFYFFLGLVFFKKVLQHFEINLGIIHLSVIVLVFGTNVFFYSVFDQTVTHIYNFFLCNLLIFLLLSLKQSFSSLKLLCFYAVLALVGIIRPTNILILGVFLFFIPDLNFWKAFIKESIRFKNVWKILVSCLAIVMIPIVLWKIQTGNWIVYSYGRELFYFDSPHIIDFLFSYTKGWFVYTPVMLFILAVGFWHLWKTDRSRFWVGIFFFLVAIYIFSCWWCWYYGAGMSQRVMIDFYIIPGYLIALILSKYKMSSMIRKLSYSIIALSVFLNVAQAYQIKSGILRWGSPTKEEYWSNFLSFQKKAQLFPPDAWKLESQGSVNLSANGDIIKGIPAIDAGVSFLEVNKTNEYSAVGTTKILTFKKGSKLVMSFECRSDDEVMESRIVFVLNNGGSFVFYPSDYVSADWTKMDFLIEPEENLSTPVEFFLWNAGSEEQLQMRSVSWKLYFTDEYF